MAGTSILWYLRSLAATQEGGQSSDSDLLERFSLRQDQAAFELLLARHGPMVWGVCRCLLADVHAAEDAFQATFLILVRKARSIGRRNLLGNWLYGVAHRVAVRARVQALRRQTRECDGVHLAPARTSGNGTQADVARILHEELNRLPDRYRSPLVLCYLQGKTREEAARQLGLSEGSVRGRLERGRERLRQQLTRRGVTLSVAAIAGTFAGKCSATSVPPALFAATMKGGWVLAAGAGASWISQSVLLLVEGALHAMLIQKMKLAAVAVVGIGVLTVGTNRLVYSQAGAVQPVRETVEKKSEAAKERERKLDAFLSGIDLGEAPKLMSLNEEDRKALLDRFKGSALLKSLLKAQLEAAQEEAEARFRNFLLGRGSLDLHLQSSVRLLQAELELCQSRDEQLRSFQAHSQRMWETNKITKLRFDSGRIPIMDYAQSNYFKERAAIWVERLKAGERIIPLGWWDAVDPRPEKQPASK